MERPLRNLPPPTTHSPGPPPSPPSAPPIDVLPHAWYYPPPSVPPIDLPHAWYFSPPPDLTNFPPPPARSEWSRGFCHFCKSCNDLGLCCVSCWCPCITFGKIAEIIDKGNIMSSVSCAIYCLLLSCARFQWIYSGIYRSRLRAQLGLVESPCNDMIVHCCCTGCALVQEFRELQNRGFHVDVGWKANMERMQAAETDAAATVRVPPVVNPGMSR